MSDQPGVAEINKEESSGDQVLNGEVKSEAKKRKEAKKAEKDAKFKAKMDKKAQAFKQIDKDGIVKPKEDKKKPKEVTKYDKDIKEGSEKDLSGPMPATYSPDYVEACWYSWWIKSGFFKPEINAPNGNVMFQLNNRWFNNQKPNNNLCFQVILPKIMEKVNLLW